MSEPHGGARLVALLSAGTAGAIGIHFALSEKLCVGKRSPQSAVHKKSPRAAARGLSPTKGVNGIAGRFASEVAAARTPAAAAERLVPSTGNPLPERRVCRLVPD